MVSFPKEEPILELNLSQVIPQLRKGSVLIAVRKKPGVPDNFQMNERISNEALSKFMNEEFEGKAYDEAFEKAVEEEYNIAMYRIRKKRARRQRNGGRNQGNQSANGNNGGSWLSRLWNFWA